MIVMGDGINKSATPLQSTLVKALQGMIDDGSCAALIRSWGLPASSAAARTVNGAG